MPHVQRLIRRLILPALLGVMAAPASAASLVASYDFDGSLAANESGVASLISIDPLNQNSFESAVVNGQSRTVFRWSGTGDSSANNAGLKLDTTGLVSPHNYSVALKFEFTQAALFGGGWRRVMDTQNRQSDSGFYVAPTNALSAVEVESPPNETLGSTLFTTPDFHDVVITVTPDGAGQQVQGWLDGRLELTRQTTLFGLDNVNNPDHLLYFFVDNLNGGAQLEFANGRIASLRLYEGAFNPAAVPEPETYVLLAVGLALVAGRRRRTRASA